MTRQYVSHKLPFPPLFFCAVALWASCALAFSLLRYAALPASIVVCVLGALGACGIAIALYRYSLSLPLIVVLGVALGFLCGGQAAGGLYRAMESAEHARVQHYLIQIVEDVQEGSFGAHALANATDEAGNVYRIRVNLPKDCDATCWDVFEHTTSIRQPAEASQAYYWRNACVGSITPYRVHARRPTGIMGVISQIRSAGISVYRTWEGSGSLFMQSIVFGQRKELFSSPFYGTVKRLGLAHMVAVSGAHLSITIALLGFLLRRIHTPRALIIPLLVMGCVVYVLLTGAPLSALRACIMAICALLSFYSKRRSFGLNALSACVIIFVILQPRTCLSTSFLLSSLSTAGIILFSDYLSSWFAVLLGNRFEPLCEMLGMTLAAIVISSPISLTMFGQFSFIAPLANILAMPFFSFLCVGGLLAGLLAVVVSQAAIVAGFMCACAQYFCSGLVVLARVPYAATAVDISPLLLMPLYAFVLGTVLLWRPEPTLRSALCAGGVCAAIPFLLFVLAPLSHGVEIIMLDVGQGDAFVLRSNSRAVLIDTGNEDTKVLKGLARHNIVHLDAILISHPDSDHCGSLPAILDFIEVDRVLVADALLDCPCENCASLRLAAGTPSLVGLQQDDVFSWGAFSATVLSPDIFRDEGGNDDSVVVQVGIDADGNGEEEACALFCGDAESEALERLVQEQRLGPVDIYKVGHHGSKGAITAEQLSVLSPRIGLVSAGVNNKYGHPAPETLALLEESSVTCFRTDISGDVVCKLSGDRIEVASH